MTGRDLRVHLLGGFRVEWRGKPIPPSAWLRRGAARTLVKLVALEPSHQLHREQILDLIWPEADPKTARNSWGKALHAARRALEPNVTGRGNSSYLLASNAVLV